MTYKEIIAEGLSVDLATATTIQNFVNCWFDYFCWSNSSEKQIVKTAKEAYAMIQNPKYAGMTKIAEASAC